MNLNGKTVLIAGGRRLGAKIAVELAKRGANIAVSYHNSRQAMLELVDRCERRGVRAEAFPADLRHPVDVNSLIEETIQTFKTLDVLINMTSIYTPTPLDTLKPDDYHEQIAANLTAPFFTAIAAARAMRRQPFENGLQGKIIQFTDAAVDRPHRDYLPYLVAKGGLVTLTKVLAIELAPSIKVNAIAPGTVEIPSDITFETPEEIPLPSASNRIVTTDDVNKVVLDLLEENDLVTGEVFRIDGEHFLGSTAEGH